MIDAPIVVREATADDVGLLTEMGARTFSETFGPQNTQADMDAYLCGAFSLEIQARELDEPGAKCLLAHIGPTPVGYARLRTGLAPEAIAGACPVEIVRFYADSPWIGRGVGSALMRSCLEIAATQGCDAVWLDVWERNPRAISFYSGWGFEIVGEQEFVLGDDVQHDLLMARPVAGPIA
jgi:diamine N-acetyltransferase